MNLNTLLDNVPDWATTTEAVYWYVGFGIGATVRVFRASLGWVKRAGDGSD